MNGLRPSLKTKPVWQMLFFKFIGHSSVQLHILPIFQTIVHHDVVQSRRVEKCPSDVNFTLPHAFNNPVANFSLQQLKNAKIRIGLQRSGVKFFLSEQVGNCLVLVKIVQDEFDLFDKL